MRGGRTVRIHYVEVASLDAGDLEGTRVKPAPFIRHVPCSLGEAVSIRAEVAPRDDCVLAGAQRLVSMMALRLTKPARLVNINEIEELGRIRGDEATLCIGACVRHAAFHKSVVDNPLGALLAKMTRAIAHYPIRLRGTFCGSLRMPILSPNGSLLAATLGASMMAQARAASG